MPWIIREEEALEERAETEGSPDVGLDASLVEY
jgi:hypothetical protein